VVGCDEQEHLVVEEGARPVDVKENGIGGEAADSAPVPRSGTPAGARGRGTRRKGASGWVGGGMRPQ